MRRITTHPRYVAIIVAAVAGAGCAVQSPPYVGLPENIVNPVKSSVTADTIQYHPVRVDGNGHILPWYSAEIGDSYDIVIKKVWDFWKNIEIDVNGIPYYMNHQVWSPRHDRRGIGGDQLMMALSSWNLLYDYTGDESIIENMKFMADYYLAHSLSSEDSEWPHLPYPYDMVMHSGVYDGDMILGKGYTQPDKAGSFAYELVHLYKKTGETKYLDAAERIANTLAAKVQPGDNDHSPWPFKVHAESGVVGILVPNRTWHEGMHDDLDVTDPTLPRSSYTTNWPATMELFQELIALERGDTDAYRHAYDVALNWMKTYPARTQKWGPFFEDVPRWSDTQINAVTYAMFLMDDTGRDPDWRETVNNIFRWVHEELADDRYGHYGVVVTTEQTAYSVRGNSHSARQASMELRYWEMTGDTSFVRNAVRQLNWATYTVDHDGKNFYPTNAIWMTDGYGDYVRHYIRAMAAAPELAPRGEDRLLRSSSIIQKIEYRPDVITYRKFDADSRERIHLTSPPKEVVAGGRPLREVSKRDVPGWTWQPLPGGGILEINQMDGMEVRIVK